MDTETTGDEMPMLAGIIDTLPRVYADKGFVKVDVLASGVVIERVALSPHLTLLLADALRRQAIDLLQADAGNVVIFPSAEHG